MDNLIGILYILLLNFFCWFMISIEINRVVAPWEAGTEATKCLAIVRYDLDGAS